MDSGIIEFYAITNTADRAKLPVRRALLKTKEWYEARTVGFRRYYTAKQANVNIEIVARTWRLDNISTSPRSATTGSQSSRFKTVLMMTDSKSLTFHSKGRLKDLTLEQLENILAEVPDRIAVSQYESVSDTMPRIVWNETRLSQTYGSNEADQMAIKVIVELISKPETARRDMFDVVDVLREHKIPFTAQCGYDESLQAVSYEFSIDIMEPV